MKIVPRVVNIKKIQEKGHCLKWNVFQKNKKSLQIKKYIFWTFNNL